VTASSPEVIANAVPDPPQPTLHEPFEYCAASCVAVTVLLVIIEPATTPDAIVVAQDPALVVTFPVRAGIAPQGSEVALVRTIALGVPNAGVTSVGEVAFT
jgi:hypothetical protein